MMPVSGTSPCQEVYMTLCLQSGMQGLPGSEQCVCLGSLARSRHAFQQRHLNSKHVYGFQHTCIDGQDLPGICTAWLLGQPFRKQACISANTHEPQHRCMGLSTHAVAGRIYRALHSMVAGAALEEAGPVLGSPSYG